MSTPSARVVAFLGLGDVTETVDDAAVFPLGILYPYTRDLQGVCTAFTTMSRESPGAAAIMVGENPGTVGSLSAPEHAIATAYVAAIAGLHSRIVFAPGTAGASVGAAYQRVSEALKPARHGPRQGAPR